MLYSYDALGLGHVRRMVGIARAALDVDVRVSALLVTCSPQINALPTPRGLDWIKLPSARKLGHDRYESRTLAIGEDEFRDMRSRMVTEIAGAFRPHFLLVDKSPLGLMGELSEALETMRRRGRPRRLVLGWRDILDDPEGTHAAWESGGWLAAIERHYDEIWVFGDPAVFDVREEYAMPSAIASRVRYLGYLAPVAEEAEIAKSRARWKPAGARLALVTAGGGEDGEPLVSAWMDAARRGLLPSDLHSLVVAGPFLPADALERLRAEALPRVTVVPFVPGLESAIAAADVVVSMAGYNTVCEVLGAGVRSVLVPRAAPREEQRIRAQRLERLGRVRVVAAGALGAEALAGAARESLEAPAPVVPLRLDGLDQVARAVRHELASAVSGNGAGPHPLPLGGARP